MRIRDEKKFVFGMEKIRIRDKHSGSATQFARRNNGWLPSDLVVAGSCTRCSSLSSTCRMIRSQSSWIPTKLGMSLW